MRRWQICGAVFLALVMSAPAAEAAVAPEEGAPGLVSGLLLDSGGRQVPGSVEVFAWPTGRRPVEVGQTVERPRSATTVRRRTDASASAPT